MLFSVIKISSKKNLPATDFVKGLNKAMKMNK